MEQKQISKSKYLKQPRETFIFRKMSVLFLVTLFFLPQYFGIPFPLFDFTALRIMIIIVTLLIFADYKRKNDFIALVIESKVTYFLIPYLIVLSYTLVLRADINAFLNPFLEIFAMYLLVYVIKFELGIEKAFAIIVKLLYVLAVLGLIEMALGRPLFSYLETIKGTYTGAFVRSGYYRIMGPCIHSLGYGLMLIAVMPLVCYDEKAKRVNLFKRPVLLIMLVVNVFLTGSRSTLGVMILELVLIFFYSGKQYIKKYVLFLVVVLALFVAFLVVFHNTGAGRYIMLQITSVVDEALGTTYSLAYGADLSALSSSSNYRDQLKYIYQLDWLNPFLGIGRKRSFAAEINGSFVLSVDDFYAAEYIRYAYTGLFSYILFLGYNIFAMVKQAFVRKSALCKILLVSGACYLLNLKWVDSLQTLKYLYILFAFAICVCDLDKEKREENQGVEAGSRYMKKRGIKWKK